MFLILQINFTQILTLFLLQRKILLFFILVKHFQKKNIFQYTSKVLDLNVSPSHAKKILNVDSWFHIISGFLS